MPGRIEGTIHPIQQRYRDVAPDGKRLFVALPTETARTEAAPAASSRINLVLNWLEEWRARAPTR